MKNKNDKKVKKSKSWIIILILLIAILAVVGYIAKTTLELENEYKTQMEADIDETQIDENKEISEVKVSGYHLVTYNQSANDTSFIKNLTVTASNPDKVKFVIGSISENSLVEERMSFEIDCEDGDNTFNLIDKRYIIKAGEYLFMDISGQDVLYEQNLEEKMSLVQTENEQIAGSLPMIESNYVPPFKYSLEKVSTYNVLVIGNDITTQNGGAGLGATDDKHDYYYLTKTRLEEKFDYVNMSRVNAVNWETNNQLGQDRVNWLMKNLPESSSKNLDLIIFQLGDNYNKDDDLETGMRGMVNYLRKYSPNAEMVWVGMWNINEQRLNNLPGICERLKIEFVNISDLAGQTQYQSFLQSNVQENNSGLQSEFTNINGAFYPNNEAMQIISNRIIEKLKFNF